MAAVTLRLRSENAERALRRLRTDAPARISRALNRAIVSARTVMLPVVSKDLGVKQGTAREAMKIREARGDKLQASLETTGARIPLYDFGAKGPVPSRGKGRGVTARIQGQRKTYPHAFIGTMRSGHVGVFQRSARARLPIYEMFGPSLPHVFTKYIPVGITRGEEALVKNLQSEFRFLLMQQGAGV